MHYRMLLPLPFAVTLTFTACGGKVCAGVGLERVNPSEVTIAVGQRVTPDYQTGGGCASGATGFTDEHYETRQTRWSTKDTLVVGVDSLSGAITGRSVGDAHVDPHAPAGTMMLVHVR